MRVRDRERVSDKKKYRGKATINQCIYVNSLKKHKFSWHYINVTTLRGHGQIIRMHSHSYTCCCSFALVLLQSNESLTSLPHTQTTHSLSFSLSLSHFLCLRARECALWDIIIVVVVVVNNLFALPLEKVALYDRFILSSCENTFVVLFNERELNLLNCVGRARWL